MSLSLPHGTGDGGRESLCGRGALIVRRPALSSGAGDPHHKEACGGSGGWGGRGRLRRVRSNLANPHLCTPPPPSPPRRLFLNLPARAPPPQSQDGDRLNADSPVSDERSNSAPCISA